MLALTYRSATASQNALLGHAHGLPVLASDVGTFGQQVVDGVDGLVVPPDDEDALVGRAAPAERAAAAAPPAGQRAHPGPVQPVGPLPRRARGAGLTRRRHRRPAGVRGGRPARRGAGGRPSLPDRVLAPLRRAIAARRPALTLTRSDLPDWIRASDVLTDGADADEARDWARSLGLPRAGDPIAAWAALGASPRSCG